VELRDRFKIFLRTSEEVVEFHNILSIPLPSFFNMRVRSEKYYVIRCQRKKDVKVIEIENDNSQDVVYFVCDLFKDRLKPAKDGNGSYKRDIPYSTLSVAEVDKRKKYVQQLTHGNIYNLSPTQVKERIINAIIPHE